MVKIVAACYDNKKKEKEAVGMCLEKANASKVRKMFLNGSFSKNSISLFPRFSLCLASLSLVSLSPSLLSLPHFSLSLLPRSFLSLTSVIEGGIEKRGREKQGRGLKGARSEGEKFPSLAAHCIVSPFFFSSF